MKDIWLKLWINYILHFLGGILFYLIFRDLKIVIIIAVTWEISQFETWWNSWKYKLDVLLNYNWLDTLIDIGLALVGASLTMATMARI